VPPPRKPRLPFKPEVRGGASVEPHRGFRRAMEWREGRERGQPRRARFHHAGQRGHPPQRHRLVAPADLYQTGHRQVLIAAAAEEFAHAN